MYQGKKLSFLSQRFQREIQKIVGHHCDEEPKKKIWKPKLRQAELKEDSATSVSTPKEELTKASTDGTEVEWKKDSADHNIQREEELVDDEFLAETEDAPEKHHQEEVQVVNETEEQHDEEGHVDADAAENAHPQATIAT
ncbi:unnamed protein product [Vicia faba]|uniref:Uncharacterized protein n=1 Tax=Vicia faba TaxID=3906 RepID=A0AAV1ALD4_VICFA|nr:unnamed protein product [Vicia faba]